MDRAAKLLLWMLLAVPALIIVHGYWNSADAWPGDMLRPTGEWSARFIIAALAITPLVQLFPASRAVRWLLHRRRAIGVAAFAYSVLHLAFYLLDMETLANIAAELGAPAIWTGWLAFLCLMLPAMVSSDAAMRALKKAWKPLQRLAYPAAALTLVHWFLVHDGRLSALAHFAPLALLQLLRLGKTFKITERKIA